MLLTATCLIGHFLSRLNKLQSRSHVEFRSTADPDDRRPQETSKFSTSIFMAEANVEQFDKDLSSEQVVLVSSGVLECPLERDGTLALSTLQSQLPAPVGFGTMLATTKREER
uniref:TDP43_N domain-containing protein n=1 Tax=Trichuris muris TaxID=70415 RepID=A0A5S6Q4T3_TRIMR